MERIDFENLRKFVAPEVVLGAGARYLVSRYARNLGIRRPLVVSDPGVAAAGWLDDLLGELDGAEVSPVVFDGVTPNPKDHEVMAGAEVFREAGCDALVALGGGSPIDCAKGVGMVAANGGHIRDYEGVDRIPAPLPPLVAIPTTAGSAADVSQFAIITDTVRRRKIAIVSKVLVPDVSLVDPETTVTLTTALTAETGLDALSHGVEALASNASSCITDLHALETVRLVAGHLRAALDDPRNPEARSGMTRASLHAGFAFSNASLGAVHALAHSLGGLRDVPHGECNAILLPHVVAYNFAAAEPAYRRLAGPLGLDLSGRSTEAAREILVAALRGLVSGAGIVGGLAERGIAAADLPGLAAAAAEDPCMLTNPRAASPEELEALYVQAL